MADDPEPSVADLETESSIDWLTALRDEDDGTDDSGGADSGSE